MNPETHAEPGSSAEWLIHAESDLRYAQVGQNNDNILPAHVCFHAQQAVEKALKAVLRFHEMDFPLVHDLKELIEIAKAGGLDLPPFALKSDRLTPYAIQTRYPGDQDEITTSEVATALELAGQVFAWAEKSTQTRPGNDRKDNSD